jgi:hypothetical protein
MRNGPRSPGFRQHGDVAVEGPNGRRAPGSIGSRPGEAQCCCDRAQALDEPVCSGGQTYEVAIFVVSGGSLIDPIDHDQLPDRRSGRFDDCGERQGEQSAPSSRPWTERSSANLASIAGIWRGAGPGSTGVPEWSRHWSSRAV